MLTPAKATLIGGAIETLGGLFGARSARKDAARLRRQQQRQFDESMDRTIQRRVRDAQLAGIHPLAALGATAGSGPTLTGAGVGAEGEAISRAGAAAGRTIKAKAIADAQLREINSRTDLNEATAGYYRSQAATRSSVNPGTDGSQLDTSPVGEASYVPPQISKSKSTGVVAGMTPGTVDVRFPDGRVVRTFSEDLQADELKQIDVLYQRAVHKGADGFMWLRNKLDGIKGRIARGRKARIPKRDEWKNWPRIRN